MIPTFRTLDLACEDVIGVGFPDAYLWIVRIVFLDEEVDSGLEVEDGMEDAVLEQTGLGAVECLDLRRLVDRQHHRMGRRINIQANNFDELLGEGRVAGLLKASPAVWAETVGLLDRLHCQSGDTSRLGHRAQCPVNRFMQGRLQRPTDDPNDEIGRRRRLARRACLVAKQATGALVDEPILPAPRARLGLSGLGHDRRNVETLAAQKGDMRPLDLLLSALGVRDDRAQLLTVAGEYGEENSIRHAPDSHATAQYRISNCTLSIRSIH